MVSAIDPTKPADGILAVKGDLRANFQAASDEIEENQQDIANILNALGLADGDTLFPDLNVPNAPNGSNNLLAILIAYDAAITAAAGSGGGGGASTLGEISDILSPTEAIRNAFQNPLAGATEAANFTFDLATHGGRYITLDTTLNSVTATLPDIATLSARSDGFLCELVPSSGSNFAAISSLSGDLRFQRGFDGDVISQSTVFIGFSRASGFSSSMRIYKDGTVYRLVGQGRTTEADDDRFGAPGTLNANVLQSLTLLDDAFPNILDLGGTKRAGGGRSLFEDIAGAHTFQQANSGKTLIHTGGGDETWNVPVLLPGTEIDVENEGGNITYNIQGGQSIRGGLLHASETSAALKWLNNGRVVLLGTS